MLYGLLADSVVLFHLVFILFVLFGGLLVLKWRRVAWVHVPASVWGVLNELLGWWCPLTPLENWLRENSGRPGYETGFIEHYILPIVYPDQLTREIQIVLGGLVLLINGLIYGVLLRRVLRARLGVTLCIAVAACAGLAGSTFRSAASLQAAETPDTTGASRVSSGPADSLPPWRPPRPRSIRERVDEREEMVSRQIESASWYRDAVTDTAVLHAMRTVPRHVFVPRDLQRQAYHDGPLPIGHGQTISQPYIVAVMTELLGLTPDSKVLEIGTGSGYQAAVLAHLTPHVYTIEIIEPLAKRAAKTLADEGYDAVEVRHGDGYYGWPEVGPFDAVIVTCAAGHLPPPLWEQLEPGGRIVIPIGGPYSVQRLVVVEKSEEGKRKTRAVMDVRFVPMTGRAGEE